MSEAEFLARLTAETNCRLLLDVNNVFVSSVNHDYDPQDYLRKIPCDRVVQFHLAGHKNCGTHVIDTHDGPVIDPVWDLYRLAHEHTGGAATLLEWDANIPTFNEVHAEVLKAKRYLDSAVLDGDLPASRVVTHNTTEEPLSTPLAFMHSEMEESETTSARSYFL
jgi:uncharacterized protein (UPF0276 family)